MKTTQVSKLANVQNIGTQTAFISHVKTKVLKMHNTQMGNTDTIENKFPHMQKRIDNGLFWKFLQILDNSDQLIEFITLIKSIACGNLPTSNIAWKCSLY